MNIIKLFKETLDFFYQIYRNKYLLFELAKRDFKQKYAANVMGIAWAVLDPIALMLIFWFIFGVGLRGGQNLQVPFVTYLITGLSVYMFFQQTLAQSTVSIKAYSFLLKKVNFRISILPLVKIFSETMLHLIVLGIAMIIILANGIQPSWYWLQIFYYLIAVNMLLLGLSWFASSVYLFFPDINIIIQIILRFFFYLTPIFWSLNMFPEKIITVLKINPMFYIVQGYRNSLLYAEPFWNDWQYAAYFWAVTTLFLLTGIKIFQKLKPHFADVA